MPGVDLTITVSDETRIRIEDENRRFKVGGVALDDLRIKTINIFEEWLKGETPKISRREELKVLGHHLYQTLFNGEVELFFKEALSRAGNAARLRVRLNFEETAPRLAALPWEYLWYPPTDNWFATAANLVLSRYLPAADGDEDSSLDPDEPTLRILVMTSEPRDKSPVLGADVIEAIKKLSERLPIEVIECDNPSSTNLVEVLRAVRPHILHFVGHGRFVPTATPPRAEIALLDPNGLEYLTDEKVQRFGETEISLRLKPKLPRDERPKASWCRDQDFAEFFGQAGVRPPRLVFLHLCEGAAIDLDASFAGLAPQLVRRARVPAVIAMQYPIQNRFAIQFSRAFYEEWAGGKSGVDEAVQVARYHLTRKNVEAYDNRVFGTPVLYMYSRNFYLRPTPPAGGSRSLGATNGSASIPIGATNAAPPIGTRNSTPRSSGSVVPDRTADEPIATTDRRVDATSSRPITPRGGDANVLATRIASGNTEFRRTLREARRRARTHIDDLNLPEAERDSVIRRLQSILDELDERSDEKCLEILDNHAKTETEALRGAIDVVLDVIEPWLRAHRAGAPSWK